MTTPPVDPNRLKTAGVAAGASSPQLAYALATSQLSPAQIQAVGGFAQAMQLNTANQLAADSGVPTNFTPQEQNHLAAVGATPANQPPSTATPDTRSWLEKAADWVGTHLADGGNFIFHNPVTHAALTGLDWLGNAAHMPFRMLSAGFSEDTQARDTEMKAFGYDPTSTVSKLAFMFSHGESEYHDLSHLRQEYGDDLVDLAVQAQADPAQFQQDLQQMDPARSAQINATLNSDKFKSASAAVDALHISPGRDLAQLVTAPFGANTENNWAFKHISGVLDAAYDWLSDPTLVLGKVSAGLRAADAAGRVSEDMNLTTKLITKAADGDGGLAKFIQKRARHLTGPADQVGIYKTLGVSDDAEHVVLDTEAGRAVDSFVDLATKMRDQQKIVDDAKATDEARQAARVEQARLYTQMDYLHSDLMPLLPEVNGTRVLGPKGLKFDEDGVLKFEQHANLDDPAWQAELSRLQAAHDDAKFTLGQAHLNHSDALSKVRQLQKSLDDEGPSVGGRDQAEAALADARMNAQTTRDLHAGATRVEQEARAARDAHFAQADAAAPADATQTAARPTYDATITSRQSGGLPATKTDPITTRTEFAKYIASKGGLLRLADGQPAQAQMLMPGHISLWGQRMAARKANTTEKWINYTDTKLKLVPTEQEAALLQQLDQAGVDPSDFAKRGQMQYNLLRSGTEGGEGFAPLARARARLERLQRRLPLVSKLPSAKEFDLTDAATVTDVERFARFYLNKGDARLLAASYANGDLAARRAVVRGMLQQSFHASGIMRTPAGRRVADEYLRDFDRQVYGLEDTDLIQTPRGQVHAALYQSQLSTKVPMPPLKELNRLAVRFAVDSWASKAGLTAGVGALQGNRMDALYGHIKMGWITSAAGGLRNALDELAGFMTKGMFSQWVKGRIAYSAAMKESRDLRRAKSLEYMQRARANGREAADDWVAQTNHAADQGVEQAQRDVERSVRARLELENVDAKAAAPLERARDRVATAQQAEAQAKATLKTVTDSGDLTSLDQLSAAHRAAIEEREAAEKNLLDVLRKRDAGKLPTADQVRQATLDRHARDGVLDIDEAEANLKAAVKQREEARALENAIHHKIPYFLRRMADTTNDVIALATMSKLLRVYGPRWVPSADEVAWVKELQNEELRSILREGVQQTHYVDSYGAVAGPGGAMDMHRDGLMARRYAFIPAGWGTIEPDGGQGLDSFAKYLGLRFADPGEASHEWVRAYKDYGSLTAARDAVRAHLDDPSMRHFIANAEVMQTLKDGTKVTDAATLAQAKDELADRISADLTHGLFSRQGDGKINEKLLDQLVQAKEIGVPDASWISHNVPVDERPAQTVGQLWAVHNPAHVPGKFPRGYAQMMSKSYQKVVTDQIDALSRNPILAALYINARRNTKDWEKFLVDEGWDEASAAATVQRMALSHAEQEAYKHVDNPWVASQFSLISRNFINFERAQEDWLRRWGRAIADNPSIIRKAQLALHAGTATGLVEQDPTQPNSLYFVYPGSQLAIKAFNGVMRGMGLGDKVQIPVTGELTSQLQFLSPSLQQPFGLTASPIITLPFKAISSTVGQDHKLLMASLDEAMNGQLGSGRSWYEQILPPTINRIIRGVVQSDPGSQYGQAYANAAMALGASGYFDKLNGTDPTALSNAQDALAAQTRNNMVLNVLFGFFAPAVPSLDNDTHSATGHGTTPDWSAHQLGYKSLKVEAQAALNQLGPTQFRLWWAQVHPHELIWDPTAGVGSHTKAGIANAYLPATLNAAEWLQNTQDFQTSYGGAGGVAAYFVPSYQHIAGYDDQGNPIIAADTSPANQFNELAYRAQLQDHMRQYKSLDEIVPGIIIQRGESEYYAAKDQYDSQIQAATDSGDRHRAKELEDQWTAEKADIYQRNPLLAQKNASYATNGTDQQVAIGQLRKLVDDHSASTAKAIGNLRDGVQVLLDAYDYYQTGDTTLKGKRSGQATAARAQLLQTYQAEVQAVAQQYPDLADLVRGVFRTP